MIVLTVTLSAFIRTSGLPTRWMLAVAHVRDRRLRTVRAHRHRVVVERPRPAVDPPALHLTVAERVGPATRWTWISPPARPISKPTHARNASDASATGTRQLSLTGASPRRRSSGPAKGSTTSSAIATPTGVGPEPRVRPRRRRADVADHDRRDAEAGALRPAAVGRDDPADAGRAGAQHPASRLDRAQRRRLRVLVRSFGRAEPRVVGRDQEQRRDRRASARARCRRTPTPSRSAASRPQTSRARCVRRGSRRSRSRTAACAATPVRARTPRTERAALWRTPRSRRCG